MNLKNFFTPKTNLISFCYRKYIAKKTILYFIPHQDDELLTMGIDICSSTKKGYNVHVILCTDGRKDITLSTLQNQQKCTFHDEPHIYKLTENEFIQARDTEFINSCLLLGVPQQNIHIPSDRGIDASLEIATAETIIQRYLHLYGKNSAVHTIHFNTGNMQHKDHKTLGQAAYNLWQKGLIHKVKFFKEPYCNPDNGVNFICRQASPEIASHIYDAIRNYQYWAPAAGRYAVGYHSVTQLFDDLYREMKIYHCKMHK